jgi:8-oxo-dGTP pyrophosphatase MutT (NUDIX family)
VKRYVVGFLISFPSWGPNVLLILKSHPEWQRGRHNGIGGLIEDGETPAEAMAREFREETGCAEPVAWTEYARLSDGRGWLVHFFHATGTVEMQLAAEAHTREAEEPVSTWHLGNIDRGIGQGRLIPNLGWLIPLALDRDVALAEVAERAS